MTRMPPMPDREGHPRAEHLVELLLDVWARPIADQEDAVAAFRALYADPVTLNCSAMPLDRLVRRAADMHTALEHSALGDVAATGRIVTVRTIDILTVTDGLISDIVVNSDEVSLLSQLGARVHHVGSTDG